MEKEITHITTAGVNVCILFQMGHFTLECVRGEMSQDAVFAWTSWGPAMRMGGL